MDGPPGGIEALDELLDLPYLDLRQGKSRVSMAFGAWKC